MSSRTSPARTGIAEPMASASATAKPVIIFRLGSLGDTVVALPCFHAIARAFPDQPRLALTNVPVSSKAAALEIILSAGGFIQGAIDYPVGLRDPAGLWRLRARLRATGADTLVYLSPVRPAKAVRRDRLFFRLCGFTRIIGLPLTEDLRVNRIDRATQEVEPEAERLARNMAALGPIDLDDRANWDLRLTAAERAAGAAAIAPLGGRRFFAVNLGGKAAEKDWGDANWSALVQRLAAEIGDRGLVAVGAGEDFERSAAVLACWPGPTANLCGALSPRETAAALAQADFFVGHDSGPLHLAAAGNTPTAGLFGGYNRPRQWHPYGPGHEPVHEMDGMAAIGVERVHAAARKLIAERP